MDREFLEHSFELAEQHVAQSEEHVRRQRELVERLAAIGHDTTQAEYLLQEFEHGLTLHKADRDRILQQLAKSTH